ncbi:MAG: hypothetical protein ACTSRP_11730 [Candidatus Helarchaeota archaeon]
MSNQSDPCKLHSKILKSRYVKLFSEAKFFPFTSLKYHLLISCSPYYNFKQGCKPLKLYLCENLLLDSQLQIIYKDRLYE